VRLEAAAKLASTGYPLGFMVAPIILEPAGTLAIYGRLLEDISVRFSGLQNLPFEFITHRYNPAGQKPHP
jgi:spore photoproduct lyase